MEENTHFDHRTIQVVHETDRTSSALLAKVYQHLTASQEALDRQGDSVQAGVTMTPAPVLIQEVRS